MTIFLCGFMGCGKTTVGKALSRILRIPFIDTDEIIAEKENMSIPKIFEGKGEPYFRKIEAETVRSLCSKTAIVACGGGAMLNGDTAAAAKNAGAYIVLLDHSFETCYSRIKDDTNRPIVQNNTKEQLIEIFKRRAGVYRSNATHILTVAPQDTPEEIAMHITDILNIAMPGKVQK